MKGLTGLKVGFFGTPEFSLNFLKKLYSENVIISFVVSQPASKSGRGKIKTDSPVTKWAKEKEIDVLTPKSCKEDEFREFLKSKEIDFIIIVAYGKLVDNFILSLPKYFAINVHASLLPRWRGAAPIQRAILENDEETGVCIMKVEEKLDSGPVMAKTRIPITPADNSGTIFNKVSDLGSKLMIHAITNILENKYDLKIQNEDEATYANKILKKETRIKWNSKVSYIFSQVRAFSPKPGAWTVIQETKKRVKILKVELISKQNLDIKPGFVDKSLIVKCGDGFLKIKELQPEGKKKMAAGQFINGLQKEFFFFE